MCNLMKGLFRIECSGDCVVYCVVIVLVKVVYLLLFVVVVLLENLIGFVLVNDLISLFVSVVLDMVLLFFDFVVVVCLLIFVFEVGWLYIFWLQDGVEEYYVVEIGWLDCSKFVLFCFYLVCFIGDVLGSLKCDCGFQLYGVLV